VKFGRVETFAIAIAGSTRQGRRPEAEHAEQRPSPRNAPPPQAKTTIGSTISMSKRR
jgi:hypothetical protein